MNNSQFSIIQTYEFPDDLLSQPLWREKFSGFLGIRADIRFRLQVNAQPFQAGRLMAVWVPYAKYLGAYSDHYFKGNEFVMPAVTGCPRTELDLSMHTEMDLLIPYVSPHSHFNLASGEGYYGKLVIVVYSPLVDTSGSGLVDCTAWINFENIDLAFPTGANLVTKSVNPSAQVGAEEVKAESYRSIAQDAGKLSAFLKGLPLIPVLSDMSKPVTWALDGAEAFLKFCGYSKLQSTNVPSFFKQTPTHFMTNYDGVDMSHNLGMASENSVELMPEMVGNDTDEMAIHHIASTPCYFKHFSWSTTQSTKTKLVEFPVNPAEFLIQGGDNLYCPTLLSYVCGPFAFWNGSIDVTFKFVKTKFHSGRVRIIFQPGYEVLSSSRINYNYSMVVDLRSESEVLFRVPYVATHPWLQTTCEYRAISSTPAMLSDLICGVLYVEVLNELVSVSSVSSSVDVLMEVSAGPDFQLACPTNSSLVPVLSSSDRPITTTTSTTTTAKPNMANPIDVASWQANADRKKQESHARAQVGEAREDEQDVVNKEQLGSKPERPLWFNSTHLMGEKVISIRQLIKRSFKIGKLTSTSGTISPFRFVFGPTADPTLATQKEENMGYLDYFAHIYAFYRGGVNLKIIGNPSTVIEAYFRANDVDAEYSNDVVSQTVISKSQYGAYQPVYTTLEGAVDLAVPYYCAFHMCPVSSLNDNSFNAAIGIRPKGLVAVSGASSDGAVVYRHATDSFQFGYLLGAPIVKYTENTTP